MREIGHIAEVLSIIGFAGGFVVGLVWAILWLSRGRWVAAAAEVVDGELRWMLPNGTVHRWTLDTDAPAIPSGTDLEIHYRSFRPDVPHFDAVAHDERGLKLVTLLLLGIGIVSFVASAVLGLVG